MKRRMVSILFLPVVFLSAGGIYGHDSFGPWNPDVRIADENIGSAVLSKNLKEQKDSGRPAHAQCPSAGPTVKTVCSGPQAGAYFLIRLYQILISPQDGPNCRFSPTCSAYGRIAVERYGAILGGFMAGERLVRCNPFSPPGADPVPEKIVLDR